MHPWSMYSTQKGTVIWRLIVFFVDSLNKPEKNSQVAATSKAWRSSDVIGPLSLTYSITTMLGTLLMIDT